MQTGVGHAAHQVWSAQACQIVAPFSWAETPRENASPMRTRSCPSIVSTMNFGR
ncbi:MAG TPA: hypothetical protein VF147_00655 [Vicinamibacterales bacterium]